LAATSAKANGKRARALKNMFLLELRLRMNAAAALTLA
jgi:hypothetical protein